MQYNHTYPSAECKKFKIRCVNNNQTVFYTHNKAAGQCPAAFNQIYVAAARYGPHALISCFYACLRSGSASWPKVRPCANGWKEA